MIQRKTAWKNPYSTFAFARAFAYCRSMTKPTDDDGYRQIGPHRFKFEPPDIIHMALDGDVDAVHIAAVFDGVGEEVFRLANPYILRDARKGGAPTRDAREFFAKDNRIQRLAGVVSYGASFHVRVVVAMVDKALRILRPESPRIHFFATYEEARAWIEADKIRRSRRG
jgi:hypothetical protein